MSKQTINYIMIGVLVLIGGVSSWELISSQQLFLTEPEETSKIDYVQLERTVSRWETRKPFSFSESAPVATPSAEEVPDEEETVLVAIRNGSGITGAGTTIEDRIAALESIEIDSVTNASQTTVTTVSHKEDVPATLVAAIVEAVEEDFDDVTVTTLSDEAPTDVLITLGSQ